MGSVSFAALMTRERWIEVGRIVLCGVMVLLYWAGVLPIHGLYAAVGVGLYPLVKSGVLHLVRERKVGTELFVTMATLVALFGGEAVAGAVLMVIILIAEFVAELNTDRARASIQGLIGTVPATAILRESGGDRTVPVSEVKVGDIVLVHAGEKLPVDGVVTAGGGAVDEAPITGESVPKDKEPGAAVFAGTVLASGALDVRTEKVGADTTFARIIKLVEEAVESQAPVQRLADRVAAWLIPVVIIFLIVVFAVTGDVSKVVTLMIFTSPAELGLATPMVVIAAIARAARNGILVKGGLYLESLAKVDTIVFDKTGTLTVGRPIVERVETFVPDLDERAVLSLAAAADRRSGHPLAKAVVAYAAQLDIVVPEPSQFEVMQGRGVRALVDGAMVRVGNAELLSEIGIPLPPHLDAPSATTAYVAVEGRAVGLVRFGDAVRPGVREAISELRRTGVTYIAMLTGDNAATANALAARLGIDEVFAELMPEEKVDAIKKLQSQGRKVAMVGDGINDAPALAQADIGIAMGDGGTQAAIEAADIALMTNDLSRIVAGRAIARRAYRTIKENLFVGVGVVHVLGITAALLGWIGPIEAALIHLGPDVLVFVNSVKLLRVRIPGAV